MPTTVSGETTDRRQYVVLHGWQNHRPAEHWQHWLAGQLTARGHDVRYPQLPDPDEPSLKDWLTAVERAVARTADSELVVVCHSLSCVAWAHLASRGSVRLPVDRLLFVAPPSRDFVRTTPELAGFDLDATAHHAVTASTAAAPRLAWAERDPYCPPGAADEYPDVFDTDRIDGGGHLDMVAGYRDWPSVLQWCEDGRVRLTARTADPA
jgi:predicted alpha/beta hydrolase family esterase